MKRIELIDVVKTAGINNVKLFEMIEEAIISKISIRPANFKDTISKFIFKLRSKFKKHNRMWQRLLDNEFDWLDNELFEETVVTPASVNVGGKVGRPSKSWEDSSDRSKRRMITALASNNNTVQLASAAATRSKASPGNKMLGQIISESINDPSKAKQKLSFDDIPQMMEPEEALALKVQCGLSDLQYQQIRNASLKHHADFLPPLTSILNAKISCYPNSQEVKETSAKVPLQSMLDHTLSRIIETSLDSLGEVHAQNVAGTLHVKAGMDGASSQSIYHQKYDDTDLEEAKQNEESLFQTAVLPLKLVLYGKDFWVNDTPSSSHYCRPLHLQYKKETKEVLIQEKNRLQDEINQSTV